MLLPYGVFLEKAEVSRVVAETRDGSFGILPHRLDCVAALVPGILIYVTEADGTVYLAVDEGVLAKAGADVYVSVRRAIGGPSLAELHDAVKREFLTVDEQERDVRVAVAKMESGLISRFAEFQHER
ncbi:F0F1 ATP synthase subunit epsilon [Rhodanobacter sp. MP7CTX1]|uniref:F0F1 ATP synthase subunit epsilon n=1 Tax=Rhodanobacter sp. MP7CTX1 TaxID=2723084 RepID=UPI0018101BA5|nr:F-type H+-transporting ATPase subunit epsilon [Rhodanobacter sp. MP7CTX1]